jgi:rRNA maturation endonuclease Nob1
MTENLKQCEGCSDILPKDEMEGDFCLPCTIELNWQREHEDIERNRVQEF